MTIYEHLGLKLVLKEKISEAGYTQAQFAELAGCGLANIKTLLYKKNLSLSTLEHFADILHCKVSDFFVIEHDILKRAQQNDEASVDGDNASFSSCATQSEETKENVVSTFVSNQTGKIYKIVEIDK